MTRAVNRPRRDSDTSQPRPLVAMATVRGHRVCGEREHGVVSACCWPCLPPVKVLGIWHAGACIEQDRILSMVDMESMEAEYSTKGKENVCPGLGTLQQMLVPFC